jgi:hypothetical protein
LACAVASGLNPKIILLDETLLKVLGSGLPQLGVPRPMTLRFGNPPEAHPVRAFYFGQNASLDRLADLVRLAHQHFTDLVAEGRPPFPGPTVNDWFTFLFGQAASDPAFPYPARARAWYWWNSGYHATGDLEREVIDRVFEEAKSRGLPQEPDAFFFFWAVGDVLAASAEALDRWLTQAGISFDPVVQPAHPATSPSAAATGCPEEAAQLPRMQLMVPLPDGRNLVLPIDKITGSAVAGEGTRCELKGQTGMEKLPDLMAFTEQFAIQERGRQAVREEKKETTKNGEEPGTSSQVAEDPPPHPDGPEGGCWLWWQGKRRDMPKGNVYKLVAYMWSRDSATYDELVGPVFDSAVMPQTVRSYVNKANNALRPIRVPWRLSTDSVTLNIIKKPNHVGPTSTESLKNP